jgi:outer membrane protein assembly factor BamD (BamD/ComL family)
MNRRSLYGGIWLVALVSSAVAEPSPLLAARRALDESIPQVAMQKLRTFLDGGDVPADQRRAATLLLAEALFASEQHAAAITAIRPLASDDDAEAQLLHAHILAGAGRWAEALPIYRGLTTTPAARLGEAESLQALGRTAEAVRVLAPYVHEHPENVSARLRLANLYVESGEVEKARSELVAAQPSAPRDAEWKSYLEARLLLAEERPAEALGIFEDLTREPEGLPDSLLAAVALGNAEARIALRGYEDADAPLEDFIGRYPESAYLERVFQRLGQIHAQQTNATESELHRWARKGQVRRAALARYYVARIQMREKKYEGAGDSLAAFVANHPTHPLLPQVHVMQADLAVERGDFPAAVRALEAAMRRARDDRQRAEIELRTGIVHYRQREFLLAANFFHSAAARGPALREPATVDAALAALGQRNDDRFRADYRELLAHFPESTMRSELLLEQGLSQARSAAASAGTTLDLFLVQFPSHARAAEARLALAELAHVSGDIPGAARHLRVANELPPSPATADHADYLAIFLADAKPDRTDDEVLKLGEQFLRTHRGSSLVPEVRMKLGQIYFHRDDFANAETQLATLARETPESAYAETALYLAGESAMKQINPAAIDRALALFDDVVKRGGAFKLHARQQQAIIQGRLGKEAEAVTLYDVILAADPPAEPELRFAALAGKGDNLLVLGRKDPAQSSVAIATFEQLAAAPDVTPSWRNQALYKKAKALEQLNRTPEALTAYYEVLDRSAGAEREYFWYYKAGFDAARLFEQQGQWKSAIGIYEKMAKVDGPRSAEAGARVKQLRLEKFIWE